VSVTPAELKLLNCQSTNASAIQPAFSNAAAVGWLGIPAVRSAHAEMQMQLVMEMNESSRRKGVIREGARALLAPDRRRHDLG
jgi:hypothetical protein